MSPPLAAPRVTTASAAAASPAACVMTMAVRPGAPAVASSSRTARALERPRPVVGSLGA
jgi:hypothetical protein